MRIADKQTGKEKPIVAELPRILVIDDEESLRVTLAEILRRDGYRVVTAGSGQAALAEAARRPFDVALVDLRLGDMTGIEVMSALRRQIPDLVVIMLTAHASLETAVEALRQGAHDYLFKPCQTVELRESIRQGLLKRNQARQQRAALRMLEQTLTNTLTDIRAAVAGSLDPAPPPADEETPAPAPPSSPAETAHRFLQRGGLIVDFARHIITFEGHLLELSPTEFGTLAYLAGEAPRVISPQELVENLRGYRSDPQEAGEIIRSHIYHLRRKIRAAVGRADLIRTVRGVGYTLNV